MIVQSLFSIWHTGISLQESDVSSEQAVEEKREICEKTAIKIGLWTNSSALHNNHLANTLGDRHSWDSCCWHGKKLDHTSTLWGIWTLMAVLWDSYRTIPRMMIHLTVTKLALNKVVKEVSWPICVGISVNALKLRYQTKALWINHGIVVEIIHKVYKEFSLPISVGICVSLFS